MNCRLSLITVVWTCVGSLVATRVPAEEAVVRFIDQGQSLSIAIGEQEVARYVYRDEKVPRPYFTQVRTPSGIEVTRRHPPQAPQDATDHVGIHTGVWLSFGDLNSCDYWRLKAKTEHVEFVEKPSVVAGRGTFTVRNRYLDDKGNGTICEEQCRYDIQIIPGGYVMEMTSEFTPGANEIIFGDQEEMGLGIRLATPLAVDRKQGGRILDSEGRRNGAEVWGKTASWCDYAGPLEGKWVGVTVMVGPENFRPSWMHARDYGFLAVNPFGRKAFTGESPSRVIVKPSETFKLRFGIVVHESASEQDFKAAEHYRVFAKSASPAGR